MSTLTPRTDAAWAQTFEDEENYGNAATDMRAECATLERELATEREKSERYRLATLKLDAELTAERARLNWLDQQGAHYGWKVQLPADYPNVKECVFVCRNTTSGHKTIREAIDAAMKEGK
jgi:hypothetical protein